jgi:hypothetical protein
VKRSAGATGTAGARTGVQHPPTGTSPPNARAATAYVPAVPTVAAEGSEPFEVDPDKLDRATQAHADLQNFFADRLLELGLDPLSPAVPHDPEFDIAWRHDGTLNVCEVKTTTPANRDRQLRLALGQVLHYAKQLETRGERVRSLVLTPTSDERGDLWMRVLHGAGVAWLWRSLITSDDGSARAALLPGG